MTPLPLLVLEAGSGTKFLTNSANPTLWTLFGSHKELGGASFHFIIFISYAHSFHMLTKSMSQHTMFEDYSLTIFNML
jgi:hypothetical protein